jgi:hypothetical protein
VVAALPQPISTLLAAVAGGRCAPATDIEPTSVMAERIAGGAEAGPFGTRAVPDYVPGSIQHLLLGVQLDSMSRERQSECWKGLDRLIAANLTWSIDGDAQLVTATNLGAILWPRGLQTEMQDRWMTASALEVR